MPLTALLSGISTVLFNFLKPSASTVALCFGIAPIGDLTNVIFNFAIFPSYYANISSTDFPRSFAISSGVLSAVKPASVARHTFVLLLEPKDSMLMVANKSGRSSKLGLIFTSQICDSPYIGEYHLGVYNTSRNIVELKAGISLVQMIHTPIFLTKPEEIDSKLYEKLSNDWGTRGTNGFGSSDKKDYEPTNPQDVEGD